MTHTTRRLWLPLLLLAGALLATTRLERVVTPADSAELRTPGGVVACLFVSAPAAAPAAHPAHVPTDPATAQCADGPESAFLTARITAC